MGRSVARRSKRRKPRRITRTARRTAQRRVQAQIDGEMTRVVQAAVEEALREEVTALLGRPKGARRDPADRTVVAARCNRCGSHHRRDFSRAGTYRRSLLTSAAWSQVAVPRVSCRCGGMVDVEFALLRPYARLWDELGARARELAGLCVSLRDSVAVLAWGNGQPLALGTLNRLVNETARLAATDPAAPIGRVPAVVQLDGIWLKLLEPTGVEYVDRQGRRRQRHQRRTFPLLVAYGIEPASGQRWVLDWVRGQAEDQASWQQLLERLLARGVEAARGLRLFVHDGSAGLEAAFAFVHFGAGVA